MEISVPEYPHFGAALAGLEMLQDANF